MSCIFMHLIDGLNDSFLMCLPWADVEIHPDIRKQFWDPHHWPKHVLVRYTWLVIYDIGNRSFNFLSLLLDGLLW